MVLQLQKVHQVPLHCNCTMVRTKGLRAVMFTENPQIHFVNWVGFTANWRDETT